MEVGRRSITDHRPVHVPGVEISKECSWDAYIAKVAGKGKAHVGTMDAILTDTSTLGLKDGL